MKKIYLAIVAVLAAVVLAGIYFWPQLNQTLNPPPDIDQSVDGVITLQRSGCYGTCPIYSVVIYGDGSVIYDGTDYVAVKGHRTAKISQDQVRGLVGEFDRIGYFSLKDKYTGGVTDLPTKTTSITIGGRHKEIVNYYGAPAELNGLEKKIDEVAGTRQWVGD